MLIATLLLVAVLSLVPIRRTLVPLRRLTAIRSAGLAGDIERTQGAAVDFPSGISKVESFRSVGTGVVPNMRRSQYLVSLSP